MSPNMLVTEQEDKEGKLEVPTSTSLLIWMLVIKMGKLEAPPHHVDANMECVEGVPIVYSHV
eukprot:4830502-Ditylum_brightwellii.AAC.2